MRTAAYLLMAAAPLLAQPKLLVNAAVDTRTAAAGLESVFHSLLTAQPQPAWIGYDVPAVRGASLGCEYVLDGEGAAGIVHLEPPGHVVILYRVEAGAVGRIRALSPDCEIDAGGLPVHWLTGVAPAGSVALLAAFVTGRELDSTSALNAIAAHADASADAALDRFLAPSQPEWLRRATASFEGAQRGSHGVEAVKNLLASDTSESVKQSALSGLARSKAPEALAVLISTARGDRDPRVRAQAVGVLGRKPAAQSLSTIQASIAGDPDTTVRRRAVEALASLPDGDGVPALINLVKASKDAEVRKTAMNRLQSSRDSRAEAFFEDVLK